MSNDRFHTDYQGNTEYNRSSKSVNEPEVKTSIPNSLTNTQDNDASSERERNNPGILEVQVVTSNDTSDGSGCDKSVSHKHQNNNTVFPPSVSSAFGYTSSNGSENTDPPSVLSEKHAATGNPYPTFFSPFTPHSINPVAQPVASLNEQHRFVYLSYPPSLSNEISPSVQPVFSQATPYQLNYPCYNNGYMIPNHLTRNQPISNIDNKLSNTKESTYGQAISNQGMISYRMTQNGTFLHDPNSIPSLSTVFLQIVPTSCYPSIINTKTGVLQTSQYPQYLQYPQYPQYPQYQVLQNTSLSSSSNVDVNHHAKRMKIDSMSEKMNNTVYRSIDVPQSSYQVDVKLSQYKSDSEEKKKEKERESKREKEREILREMQIDIEIEIEKEIIPIKPTNGMVVGCSCSRTHCLKLYCDCLRTGKECGKGCSCYDCYNREGMKERKKALDFIKKRNPKVYMRLTGVDVDIDGRCNCQRSHCIKKYCACFVSERLCNPKCNCYDCCNVEKKKD